MASTTESTHLSQVIAQEARMWASLKHLNVLPFVGIFKDTHHTYLVSDFMPLGNLADFVVTRIQWLRQATKDDRPLYKKFREADIVSLKQSGGQYTWLIIRCR